MNARPRRVLVVGLGSMGRRRIRNLRANGVATITGVDPRSDRRDQAEQSGATCFADLDDALQAGEHDAWIVSVPPDLHHRYLAEAARRGVPAFVEASVLKEGLLDIHQMAERSGSVIAPSCTLHFHPAIERIAEILASGRLGTVSSATLHSGQYLPDWHHYEPVSEYYVSQRETGGAREIVPFELTWVTMLFGFPSRIAGVVKKTIDIPGADQIDDTYHLLLDYPGMTFNLCVDVVSRHAVRRLLINGELGQLRWDWDEARIRLFEAEGPGWSDVPYSAGTAHAGYNPNIGETMYEREIEAFLAAAAGERPFPNSLDRDVQVLDLLYAAEESSDQGRMVSIE